MKRNALLRNCAIGAVTAAKRVRYWLSRALTAITRLLLGMGPRWVTTGLVVALIIAGVVMIVHSPGAGIHHHVADGTSSPLPSGGDGAKGPPWP
ncbi:MAG TPA: hypothetical protein VGI31_09385 [Streptosporangiaceae bacterium]|jgi:hypothetical protein